MVRQIFISIGLLLAALAGWSFDLHAQNSGGVEVDALQCWRRIGTNAVHVGEQFDMMLTCSVVETDTARAVPDLAWLEPETLTVSPFEVLQGERYRDIVRAPRRFFQYRYALRIIGEDYFGLDVELPALEVKYRIERTIEGGAVVEGRELTYVLPPESLRVLALVPAAVNDIRELPTETFGDVETRLFRANATNIAAAVVAMIATVLLLIAAVQARREWRGKATATDGRVSEWLVARTALGEMVAVQELSQQEGWTIDLISRSLTALRVAGALAIDAPLVQLPAGASTGETDFESRLRVRGWGIGRLGVLVSAPVTPHRMDAALQSIRANRPGEVGLVESIRQVMVTLSAARYGSGFDVPADALRLEVDAAVSALRALTKRSLPPVRFIRERRRSLNEWIGTRWAH